MVLSLTRLWLGAPLHWLAYLSVGIADYIASIDKIYNVCANHPLYMVITFEHFVTFKKKLWEVGAK